MRTFDVDFDTPGTDRVGERLPEFGARIVSDAPIPEIVIDVNSIRQRFVHREDRVEAGIRHVARVSVRVDATSAMTPEQRGLRVEIRVGGHLVERRLFRCDFRQDADQRPIVYVMHVPKTAGTSLRAAIEAEAPDLRSLSLYGEGSHLSQEQAHSWGRAALHDTSFVFGHYCYGLHRRFDRGYRYVSMVREPAAYIKSYYLFRKYARPGPEAVGFRSIEDAIETSGDAHLDNCFTRYFSGDVFAERIEASHLEKAIDNIERDFAFVGTAEDMDGSVRSIGDYLGLPIGTLRENVTPGTPETEAIDLGRLAERHRARIAFDQRLYAYVRERFGRGSPYWIEPLVRPQPCVAPVRRLFMR